MSDVYGIHGQTLEVIILRCNKLKNTGLFTKQNPYVIVEYNNCKFQTRTCTDGDTEPVFDEKFHITLIAGILDMNIYVWNSNSVMRDTFIGSGRVQLNKVITEGFDDSICVIKTNGSKYAGDVKLIMHFSRNPLHRCASSCGPSAPPALSCPYNLPSVSHHHEFYHQPTYPPPSPNSSPAYVYPPLMHQLTYPPQTYPPPTYPTETYMPQNYYPPDPHRRHY